MRFVPFELERWQSTWENRVRYNLSESGVHPLSIRELLELAGASREPLLDELLSQTEPLSVSHLLAWHIRLPPAHVEDTSPTVELVAALVTALA